MATTRRALLALAIALGLSGVFVSREEGAAATLETTWSLFARADANSFTPGVDPAPAPGGYEIVSFDAVGLAAGLGTYVYGGADLPPALGGPAPPLVTCTATITGSELQLDVSGAFPYAGCVFFVGVENTGDAAARFELGPLGEEATVTCNAPGCEASDIEVLAGAAGPDPLAACRVEGGPVAFQDGIYSLPPGALVVCPVFIVVLQPAEEGATYLLEITPPPPETTPGDPGPQTFEAPQVNREPPVRSDVPPVTPTPEPTVTLIAGERTPGAPTPVAPSAGDSIVLRSSGGGTGAAAALLVVAGVACAVAALWPVRRH